MPSMIRVTSMQTNLKDLGITRTVTRKFATIHLDDLHKQVGCRFRPNGAWWEDQCAEGTATFPTSLRLSAVLSFHQHLCGHLHARVYTYIVYTRASSIVCNSE